MANLFVGTSGYSYDHWRGIFYPSDLSAKRFFEYFAERFSTVEINYSFYHIPTDKTLERWKEQAPEGFVYTLKASKLITHRHRLKREAFEIASGFCDKAGLLGEMLGCILFQLPPSLRKDIGLLKEFLAELKRGFRYVVEFRNNTWICDEALSVLEESGVAYCIVSAPGLTYRVVATAPHAYFRFHGSKSWFSSLYTPAEMKTWADHVVGLLEKGTDVFAYFNNDANAYAVKNAEQLRKLAGSVACGKARRSGSAAARGKTVGARGGTRTRSGAAGNTKNGRSKGRVARGRGGKSRGAAGKRGAASGTVAESKSPGSPTRDARPKP